MCEEGGAKKNRNHQLRRMGIPRDGMAVLEMRGGKIRWGSDVDPPPKNQEEVWADGALAYTPGGSPAPPEGCKHPDSWLEGWWWARKNGTLREEEDPDE